MSKLNPNAEAYVPINQNSIYNTARESSELASFHSAKSNEPFMFETKTSRGKKKVFNPTTSRWILDNKRSRKRITDTYSKQKKTKKKSVSFVPEPIIQYISPKTPEYNEGLTLEACQKYSKNIPINLNKLKPGKQNQDVSIEWGKANKKTFPGFLEYEGIPLNYISYISQGTYGTVYKYSNGTDDLPEGWVMKQSTKDPSRFYYLNESLGKAQWDKPKSYSNRFYEIAIKTYNDPKDPEINLVNELKKNGKNGICNLINSSILNLTYNGNKTHVSAMELMDGTLCDLQNLTSIPDKIEILKKIVDHFICIKREIGESVNYTDLKCANVLYKCFKNKKIKIVIGDIGGLCNGWDGASTYPPPEFLHEKNYKGNNCTESILVWGIAVTFLELLGYNTSKLFYWKKARTMSVLNFMRACKSETALIIDTYGLNLSINDTPFSIILQKMLEPNPNERISLSNLKKALSTGMTAFKSSLQPPSLSSSDSSEDGF
jgi:hypothetical protein